MAAFCCRGLWESSAVAFLRRPASTPQLIVFSKRMQCTADLKDSAKTDGPSTRVVRFGGDVCTSPKEAQLGLLDFLTLSDVQRRSTRIEIPYFEAGCIMAVTRNDPYSKTGSTRFVGICIARINRGLGSNFILRNVIKGTPVEVRFDLFSPMITSIEVLKLERRKRGKLYYLRDDHPRESTVPELMQPQSVKTMLRHKRRR